MATGNLLVSFSLPGRLFSLVNGSDVFFSLFLCMVETERLHTDERMPSI